MTSRSQLRTPAFTLLEVMLAVVVAAFVLVAINVVFFGALRLRARSQQALERSLTLERALGIIERDLINLAPPGGTLSGTLRTSLMGSLQESTSDSELQEDPVRSSVLQPGQVGPDFFTASAGLDEMAPWAEVQKVAYVLLDPTNRTAQGKDLVRSVTRNLLPPAYDLPLQELLLSGVESLAFLFYDGDQWRADWDSTTEETPLPQAVKVELQLAVEDDKGPLRPPIELWVPLMMDGKTNEVAASEPDSGGEE